MIAMNKPPHKFFDVHLDNNLEELSAYLMAKQDELLDGKIGNVPAEELSKYGKHNGPATQLGRYYNVFTFDNESISKLKQELKKLIIDACSYYGINFDAQKYAIHGWFNVDPKSEGGHVSPLHNDKFFHDHMGGEGAPVFHGYYCINAEPSSTFYKINGETPFENINKNNRAIVSETGHPHGRDDWYQDSPRITLAYDIAPAVDGLHGEWVYL